MANLLFYDLETSGRDPKSDRIMQFAGIRTDENLNIISEPYNYLIRLDESTYPDIGAILTHKISPLKVQSQGLAELDFLRIFYSEISQPKTVFVGFNNINFDNQFIRFLNYRNLYDPYEWSYKNNNSTWDIYNLALLTRALRPAGLNWPIINQKHSNKLSDLLQANNIKNPKAHDALNDVYGTIELARLIKAQQPKLYDYFFKQRFKSVNEALLTSEQPLVLASPIFNNQFNASVIYPIQAGSTVIYYDLRYSPADYLSLSKSQKLAQQNVFFVKALQANKCPAITDYRFIEYDSLTMERLGLDRLSLAKNLASLKQLKPDIIDSYVDPQGTLDQEIDFASYQLADEQLYRKFMDYDDKQIINLLVSQRHSLEFLAKHRPTFSEPNLNNLLALFICRVYPQLATHNDQEYYSDYQAQKLERLLAGRSKIDYLHELKEYPTQNKLTKTDQDLIRDLYNYLSSLAVFR